VEFIKNEDYKYVRLLGAFYMRLVGKPLDVYQYLEARGGGAARRGWRRALTHGGRSRCTTTTGAAVGARRRAASRCRTWTVWWKSC
jgi:hypothetical protein